MGKRLIVEATQCLLTDDISIRIEDVNQYEIVEVEAVMTDNFGDSWASSVMVQANLYGEVDMAKVPPILGSYSEPCSMGLFWAMKRDGYRDGDKTPRQPIKTTISLKRSGAVEEVVQVIRHLVHPSLVRVPIKDNDLIGTFYHHGDRRKRPTLLILGGSEGGLKEGQAALLAAKGFNALALAYFGINGLPKQLVNIPLEYFQKAIAWLEQQPSVDHKRLAVVGTSKGGELSLLLSSYDPRIKAVVAYVPSSVIHKGFGTTTNGKAPSSWSFSGEPLPFSYNQDRVKAFTSVLVDQKNTCRQSVSYREWYRVHSEAGRERSAIPVEKIKGPILLISGKDDMLWSSDIFGNQIIDRLKRNGFRFSYEHLCYPQAGHAIGYPGMPTTETTEFRVENFALKAGGTPEGNFKAQKDSWHKVISFLKQSL